MLTENWATLWEALAASQPDHVAVVIGDTHIRWRDLDERASRIASLFDSYGVGHDAKVGQLLYNCPEYLETAYASFKVRASTVNVNLRYKAPEIIHVLADSGASPQRLLWASTGVKDPKYQKDKYVTELAAPLTVNTMPEQTLRAVRDLDPKINDAISSQVIDAHKTLKDLAALGIDYNKVVADLEVDGIRKFEESWQNLLQTVKQALA